MTEQKNLMVEAIFVKEEKCQGHRHRAFDVLLTMELQQQVLASVAIYGNGCI